MHIPGAMIALDIVDWIRLKNTNAVLYTETVMGSLYSQEVMVRMDF